MVYYQKRRLKRSEKMFNHPKIKEEIVSVFPFGSKVYGTITEQSDDDYVVVVKGDKELDYGIHTESVNIHVYSEASFQKLLEAHDIVALECIFSKENEYEFTLDLEKLRRSVSSVASNSFVKCKKKLVPGPDYNPYIGKKSLFHSMRILNFGIQIATFGRIIDFSSCNDLYDEIMRIESNDWEVYKERFTKRANALKSEFKLVAPLKKDETPRKW